MARIVVLINAGIGWLLLRMMFRPRIAAQLTHGQAYALAQ